MTDLFLKIVNMSVAATWLALAVLAFRFLLKSAPKWISVLLWGLVAVRLICPFAIQSALSLIPSSETISPEIMMDPTPAIQSGIPVINSAVNPIITQTFAPEPLTSINPLQFWIPAAAIVWITGMVLMLAYSAVSYWRLCSCVKMAVRLRDNIFQSEKLASPFVLGILYPRIYLPFTIPQQDMSYVIAHECAHIRRRDHWWKPLGFILLTLHWFNPVMWIAYILLCRDIEIACDEKVIRELGVQQRADYSQALLNCSVNRSMITACPLAFGEVGVKERVKAVIGYKKPAFWIVLAAMTACIVLAVCFLTDPPDTRLADITEENGYAIVEQRQADITLSVPKDSLPDSIYTAAGYDFQENSIIVYWTETTSIYLERVQTANEGDDKLYFFFNFAYQLPESGTILTPYWKTENGYTYGVDLRSRVLTDDNGAYTDAVSLRGQGPNEQFVLCIETDACKAAVGTIQIQAYCCELTYTKAGSDTPAETDASLNGETTAAQQEDRLAVGAYIPVECIYMAPFSSYYPASLSEDFRYSVTEDAFVTEGKLVSPENTIRSIDYRWKTLEQSEKEHSFLKGYAFYDFILDKNALYQKLDSSTHIFKSDDTIYLVKGRNSNIMLERLWSVYVLVPAEAYEAGTNT